MSGIWGQSQIRHQNIKWKLRGFLSLQTFFVQFLISNQKFNVTFKKCENMEWTKDAGNPPPLAS
jgi:hypothetical protein